MKVTVIKDDNSVAVDDEGYGNLDLNFLDDTIHAIQWYDTHGEIERKDPITKKMISNEEITSFDQFQQVLVVWQAEKDKIEAEKDRIAAELILRQNESVASDNT